MMFRIQKLLMSEYREFEQMVLVENPFTEVTERAIGLRQLHIALTSYNIIIAQDMFDQRATRSLTNVIYRRQDPEIESMELVQLLPLEFVKFSFYRHELRYIMKLIIINNKELFLEFGGHLYKNLYWNTWRDRIASIRFVDPRYFHISYSSPFSSSDVIEDKKTVEADIHIYRSTINVALCATSFEDISLNDCCEKWQHDFPDLQMMLPDTYLKTQSEVKLKHKLEDDDFSYFGYNAFRNRSLNNLYSSGNCEW